MLRVNGTPHTVAKRALRVLVADDDRDTTDSMMMVIQLWGHDVRPVYHAEAVLEQASAYRPDVLLLDIAMPGLDGFKLARELRCGNLFRAAMLVAITGYGDEGHRSAGVEAGFDHYLVKPVEPETVRRILASQLDRLSPEVSVSGAAKLALARRARINRAERRGAARLLRRA